MAIAAEIGKSLGFRLVLHYIWSGGDILYVKE